MPRTCNGPYYWYRMIHIMQWQGRIENTIPRLAFAAIARHARRDPTIAAHRARHRRARRRGCVRCRPCGRRREIGNGRTQRGSGTWQGLGQEGGGRSWKKIQKTGGQGRRSSCIGDMVAWGGVSFLLLSFLLNSLNDPLPHWRKLDRLCTSGRILVGRLLVRVPIRRSIITTLPMDSTSRRVGKSFFLRKWFFCFLMVTNDRSWPSVYLFG